MASRKQGPGGDTRDAGLDDEREAPRGNEDRAQDDGARSNGSSTGGQHRRDKLSAPIAPRSPDVAQRERPLAKPR